MLTVCRTYPTCLLPTFGRTPRSRCNVKRFRPVLCSQISDPVYSIKLSNVHLCLGPPGRKRQILKGVNLQVRRGSLHMLLGPNGCGKSTLLKVLGNLICPDDGVVECDQPTGFVFQNPDHQVVMPTVAADVAFGLGRWVGPHGCSILAARVGTDA